jgi:hypothetical protein
MQDNATSDGISGTTARYFYRSKNPGEIRALDIEADKLQEMAARDIRTWLGANEP